MCTAENAAYNQETRADFAVRGGETYLRDVVDGKPGTCFAQKENGNRNNLSLSVDVAQGSLADVVNVLLFEDFVRDGN